MAADPPILSAAEIERRKSRLRKNYDFELDPDDDITLKEVFEDEFFQTKERVLRPDFYIWKPLSTRLTDFFGESITAILSIIGGCFVLTFFISLFVSPPAGQSLFSNAVMVASVLSFCFIVYLMFPIILIGLIIVLIRYRKDRRKYQKDKIWWDSYHNQTHERDAYIQNRIARHEQQGEQGGGGNSAALRASP